MTHQTARLNILCVVFNSCCSYFGRSVPALLRGHLVAMLDFMLYFANRPCIIAALNRVKERVIRLLLGRVSPLAFIWASLLPLAAQPAGGLFSSRPSFNSTNHLVSVSVFQWFTANGGQLSGPWRPVEGRSNWTGTTDFWRTQIKQTMAANVDMLYVHLIPSSEQQRVNLFQALNQLRGEGWNVPKVAPFLDPVITWDGQPLVDVSTTAGKDTFVSQYTRFFNQYFSVNQDSYADDYLARIDGRVVLDTWHVNNNLSNVGSLTRNEVESRLKAAFAQNHPVFNQGIRMVTTLSSPTLSFADEKVAQFETVSYFYASLWQSLWSVQLKGGYWDQNIRNPGQYLPRGGGIHYSNAWWRANMLRTQVRRVYLESWNEYDEGSGLYAANPGPPYVAPGNPHTDVWSSVNDPYEYIDTTAQGATTFNDWPDLDARILWHNIPTRMLPGETRTATVIVRNEGDARWTGAANYRFAQRPAAGSASFSTGPVLINDAQDDIPAYGGIFRGRAKTFLITLRAPTAPGTYSTHWSMAQGDTGWFGQDLSQTILVDPTPVYHGAPQTIDSTGILMKDIDDFSEHTYTANNLPVGTVAECAITRIFAAPIRSVRLTIVSGTADDIGYVGSMLVTPDSFGTTCRLGHVTNSIDVSSQVTIDRNMALLTLRARDTCCCNTGWGEDTVAGRLNAKFHWEVELWPPVPISPALSNAATGHFYVLLSPATWTWSERTAIGLGGHLTAIANEAENNYVYNSFSAFGGTNRLLWIGFNDVASEGHFVWSSGEPVTYTRWVAGEPNNATNSLSPNGEDFAAMYQPGIGNASRWNDWGERVFSGSNPFDGVVELAAPFGPPRITSQPQGTRVNPGTSVSFTVGAVGTPPLQYQWRRNGSNISGATNPTYTIGNVQLSDDATYSAVVANVLGLAPSSNAVLSVNHAPVARCVAVTVPAGTNCVASALVNNGSFDPDGDPIRFSQSPPGPYPLGVTPVTLTVTDGLGLTSSCQTSINVIDTTPPFIVCPTNILRTNDLNQCGAVVAFPLPVATDTCSAVTNVTCSPPSGSLFPVGTTTVQCAATDAAGNRASCSFIVTVRDAQPPTIACPADIVVTNAHDALTSVVNFSPTVSDNCPGIGTPACTPLSGSAFGLGTNIVTCSVMDAAGNSSQCSFNVVVLPGNKPPVPIIEVSPLAHFPGWTNLIVIATGNLHATVVFDGSDSYDPDDATFLYYWSEGGVVFSTNSVATNVLAVGSHEITLSLDDTFPLGTSSTNVTVEIISPCAGVTIIEDLVLDQVATKHQKPLLATLDAACAAFERCQSTPALNQLRAFQNKVRAQVAPSNPALAEQLLQASQAIIDAFY